MNERSWMKGDSSKARGFAAIEEPPICLMENPAKRLINMLYAATNYKD